MIALSIYGELIEPSDFLKSCPNSGSIGYFFRLLLDDLIMMILSKLFKRTEKFFSHKNFFVHPFMVTGQTPRRARPSFRLGAPVWVGAVEP
jgi:hypothetical protein